MADTDERSPLLEVDPEPMSPDDAPVPSAASETTPLLGSPTFAATASDADINPPQPTLHVKASRRWPSIIAMSILGLLALAILALGFIVPDAVEAYAKQGLVLEPTNLSLEAITADGVRARIQANFRLDAARVPDPRVRRIGRAATWLVRSLATDATTVRVYLPEHAATLLGSAQIPALAVSLVDGRTTAIDFVADLVPGDAEGLRGLANQWLEGRLGAVRLLGQAAIPLKTGFLPLGTHAVSESFVVQADALPELPHYDIDRVRFEEVNIPGRDRQAMGAEVRISAFNRFPVQIDVPSLAFDILVPNCDPAGPYIQVADAVTAPIAVRPLAKVTVDATGTVQQLPDDLTALCPGSESSPLDLLLKQYMHGADATVFVRGSKTQRAGGTPDWIGDLLASITVPVPFPGHSFDNLIREFSLADVHFTLPDPLADPDDPEASSPTVSGTILVTAALPDQMNFALNVTQVRADADVLYHGRKLGELDLRTWQAANSTMHRATADHEATLQIQSRIDNAPLNVTDGDVLTAVIQALLFEGKTVVLDIDALVGIRVDTVLGLLELKDVPAAGKIPVKPIPLAPEPGDSPLGGLAPQIGHIEILDTTPSSIDLRARVNITNPTDYSAQIPFISIHIYSNDTLVGLASAKDLDVQAGNNIDLVVGATWSPALGGARGLEAGRAFLSAFVSGVANTTLTLKTHRDSIPGQPVLGEALSHLNFTLPAPRMRLPDEDDDDDGDDDDDDDGDSDTPNNHRFIRSATFHVFSSSATFGLASPLDKDTLYIEALHATAYYNYTEPVGSIHTDTVLAVPPGLSVTPKLPVTWSPDSVGFDKLRKALGGELKLDAQAEVTVRLGAWRETVHYAGQGIGAHVRP